MLQYVDGCASLKFVAVAAAEDESGTDNSRLQTAIALRAEIIATIKGGYNQDLKDFHAAITEAMLKSVPPELLKKCISFMLWNDRICVRRGFVLDVWNVVSGALIGNAKDVKTICSRLSYDISSRFFSFYVSDTLVLDIIIELEVKYSFAVISI